MNHTDPAATVACPVQEVGDLKVQVAERGPWIFTYTGRRYFPTSPLPEDVFIEDIAHALAYTNRYNGHTIVPVSVAEHSLMCSYVVPEGLALEALLHDAAEAYIGDVSRPVKQWLRERDPSWDMIEYLNERAIARRYQLEHPWPEAIRIADNVVLAAEVRDAHCPEFGALLARRGIHPAPDPRATVLAPHPSLVEKRFLDRYLELAGEREF